MVDVSKLLIIVITLDAECLLTEHKNMATVRRRYDPNYSLTMNLLIFSLLSVTLIYENRPKNKDFCPFGLDPFIIVTKAMSTVLFKVVMSDTILFAD